MAKSTFIGLLWHTPKDLLDRARRFEIGPVAVDGSRVATAVRDHAVQEDLPHHPVKVLEAAEGARHHLEQPLLVLLSTAMGG